MKLDYEEMGNGYLVTLSYEASEGVSEGPNQLLMLITDTPGLRTGRVARLWPEHRYTRSQDLEEAYHDAGQFYWGKTSAFLNFGDPMSEAGVAYVLPGTRVYDIDTKEDWAVAELLFRALSPR